MNDVQRLADRVEAELIWGTDPTELVRGINPSLRVQDVVSVLSRCGMNATATRLYDADQARKETPA
jgi:hypothetical protein